MCERVCGRRALLLFSLGDGERECKPGQRVGGMERCKMEIVMVGWREFYELGGGGEVGS